MAFSIDDLKKGANRGLPSAGSTNELMALKSSLQTDKRGLQERINSMAVQVLPNASTELREKSVELISIFDKSGSCEGTERTTIQGFDTLIAQEKRKGYPTKITTVLFDESIHLIHDGIDIRNNPTLNYRAEGGTALYDALCEVLNRAKKRQAEVERPQKTIVVIMTDGKDEHSKYHNLEDARQMIRECRNLGWEFIFLGANINAKKVASELGIDPEFAENYDPNAKSILLNFKAVSLALESARENGNISRDWSKPIITNRPALTNGKKDGEDEKRLSLGGRK